MQRDEFNLRGNQKEGKDKCSNFVMAALICLYCGWNESTRDICTTKMPISVLGKLCDQNKLATPHVWIICCAIYYYILNHRHCLLPLLLKSLIPWPTLSLSTGQSTNQTTQQLVISDFDPSVTEDQHPSQSQQYMLYLRKKIDDLTTDSQKTGHNYKTYFLKSVKTV